MLMVTTTMGMLNGVHGNTSDSWPVLSLTLGFEPGVGGLEEWLVSSLSTSANSNHGSAGTLNGLSGTRWKSNSGLLTIIGVTNDDSGGSGSSGERSSISELTLAVRDDGTFWHSVDWKNISNGEGSFGSAVDKLAGVHSFDGDEILSSLLVSVCVSEDNFREWGTSAWVMNDVLYNTLHISLSLNIVESSESSRSDSVGAVRRENKTASMSLGSDASTHD